MQGSLTDGHQGTCGPLTAQRGTGAAADVQRSSAALLNLLARHRGPTLRGAALPRSKAANARRQRLQRAAACHGAGKLPWPCSTPGPQGSAPRPAPAPLRAQRARSVATQSAYRESGAQTAPYAPAGAPAAPGAKQQALSCTHHCPGVWELRDVSLPCGAAGADAVERLRVRRAFEAALPPLADVRRHPLRQRLQAAWEAAEWEERAAALERRDEARLAAAQAALARRLLAADARGAGLLLTARQSRSARVQRADAGARSRAGARCLAAVLGPMRRAAEALEVQHPGEQEALLLQRRSLAALRSLEEAMAQRLLRARFRGEQPCAGRPPRNRRSEAEYRAHLGHAYRRARARPSDAALHAKKGW